MQMNLSSTMDLNYKGKCLIFFWVYLTVSVNLIDLFLFSCILVFEIEKGINLTMKGNVLFKPGIDV